MDVYSISVLIVFIPFVIGLALFKKFNVGLKIFFVFVVCGVFSEVLAAIFVKVIGVKNNLPLFHLYGIVTFLVVGLYYRHLLQGFIKKRWINLTLIAFTAYYLINLLLIQSIFELQGIASAIGSIISILFIILYFTKVMNEANINNLFAEPSIWISGALLLYYSNNLFFFILFNLFLEYSIEFTKFIVNVRIGFNALVYLMITIGFLKQRKRSIS